MGDVQFTGVEFNLKASKQIYFNKLSKYIYVRQDMIFVQCLFSIYLNAIPQPNRTDNQPLFIDSMLQPLSRHYFIFASF